MAEPTESFEAFEPSDSSEASRPPAASASSESGPPEPTRSSAADDEPDHEHWLGDFDRGPAVFSVHRETAGSHPHIPPEYRISCNDGAGPRVICRFVDEPEAVPEWFGAWRGDEWCDWILERARALIADPQRDLPVHRSVASQHRRSTAPSAGSTRFTSRFPRAATRAGRSQRIGRPTRFRVRESCDR